VRALTDTSHALAVQQRLIDYYIPQITNVQYEGKAVEPPKPVEWYPEKLAWAMTTPKNVVRRFGPFSAFQKFLVSETSVGNISRQEIVSMIPPLLMDVRPGHTVLDLCAAPGSKSAQLIEMVHGGEEARVRKVVHQIAKQQNREASPDGFAVEMEKAQPESEEDWADDGRATGLLIANDVDYRRAQMLVHQVKRLNSPNMVVTNHDATQYPSIKIPSDGPPKYLKFDRILADVPCSGDGTCRKNPNIWKDWIPGNGLGLHVMQVRILVRSLQMLKVGGRVIYSTCSMNPVENEAVISSAIDRCGGVAKVRILDCTDSLPGLKRYAGLKQWKIMDKSGRIWNSWKEVEEAKASAQNQESFSRLDEGMFPPTDLTEDTRIPFERCMRVYAHSQDTGGFFITALEKLSEIKTRPEDQKKPKATIESDTREASPLKRTLDEDEDHAEPAAKKSRTAIEEDTDHIAKSTMETVNVPPQKSENVAEEDMESIANPNKEVIRNGAHSKPEEATTAPSTPFNNNSGPNMKARGHQIHEEPFKYLAPDHPELLKIYEYYKVSERFPRDRFMVRNATGEPVKAIYYTSAIVRDILNMNERKGMKFVMCGVKMFMKQDAQGQDVCRWRIQSEGIPLLETYVGEERIVRLYKKSTLRKLLIEMFPKVGGDGWKEMGEIGERVRDIGMGCCVLRVETSEDEDGFK
jgi:multisite-specific tRNA:(cytosine-C5)-methyltransferase